MIILHSVGMPLGYFFGGNIKSINLLLYRAFHISSYELCRLLEYIAAKFTIT